MMRLKPNHFVGEVVVVVVNIVVAILIVAVH